MMLLVVLLLVVYSSTVKMWAFSSFPGCSSSACAFTLSVFVLLTGCCTNMVAIEVSDICPNNTMHVSLDPVFQNETIDLVCHKLGTNASELYFNYAGQEYDPRDYTQILNRTAIRLKLPPFDRESASDLFKCMQGDTCVGSLHVLYEYYPLQAQDVQCRVYGWDSMLCWWSLGITYNSDVNVTCDFSLDFLSKELAASHWAKCPNLTSTSCYWDADHFTSPIDRLNISIKISNTMRPEAFVYTNISFPVDDIVQLDPVTNTSIAVIKEDDPSCRSIFWPLTGRAKYKTLAYNITYGCPCSENKTQFDMYSGSSGTASTILCGLHPYCTFTASISGRYIKSQDTPTGFWSDPTTFSFTTDKQVPSHSPETTEGLYEHALETDDNIKLYWKPLDQCELNSASTSVEYHASINNVVVDHPVFYMKLKVEEEPLTVTIQARNDLGYAKDKQTIQVFPKHIGHKSSDLTVEFSEGSLNPARQTIEPRDSSAIGHTLVWCKGSSFCEEPVQWKVLPLFELRTSLNVSKEYRFGLITKYKSGANSGIVWENCLYQAGKVPVAPPRNVHRSDHQPEEGFILEWLPYNCDEGYIHHYNLTYCTTKSETKCNCTSKITNVEVSKQETSYYEKDLMAGSMVCVWLRGVGPAGPGPNSDPVTFTITAITTSHWVYVGVSLGVLVTIILVLFIGCYVIPRLRKHIRAKSGVKDILGRPNKQPLLADANQSADLTPCKKSNYRTDPSTDSGKSSMSNDSTKTDIIQRDRNSRDSAISSDHAEQSTETNERKPLKTTTDLDSELIEMGNFSSYMKASELSGGLLASDCYSDTSGNGSGHRNQSESGGIRRGNETQALTEQDPSGKLGDDRSINGFLSDLEDEQDDSIAYELGDISAILD